MLLNENKTLIKVKGDIVELFEKHLLNKLEQGTKT